MKAKQFLMPMLLLGITSFYSMDRFPGNRVPSSVHAFRPSDLVLVEGGQVRGVLNEQTGVTSYKGIPFAAPPTGSLRWKPPQAVLPWDGVRDCIRFGPSPMQMKPVSFFMIGPEFVVPRQPLREDCLYLNVWTAAKSPDEKRPVMVWIYGGGFITGGSAAPGYSGEALAKKGIVFVSFNYRLGIFGFLAHPGLSAEDPHHASGNYALLDQIAALQWVQKNIRAFGGDPDRVTIAGQSAGAASVNCLLASPLAKNLFRGAIAESGSLVLENPLLRMKTLAAAEKEGQTVMENLKVKNIRALRSLPAETIQKSFGFYSPIVDGYVMPAPVARIYGRSRQTHVPFLTGWNAGEGFLLGIKEKTAFAKEAGDFGSDSALFAKYFPSTTDSGSLASQIALSVDKTIGVPQYAWALMQNENSDAKTFLYRFTRKPPATGGKKRFGAYHTAEIGYALHNLDSIRRPWEPVDRRLEDIMSRYWINFVKTGNPNGAQLPDWPAFSSGDPQTMFFDEQPAARRLPDQAALDFLYNRYPGR